MPCRLTCKTLLVALYLLVFLSPCMTVLVHGQMTLSAWLSGPADLYSIVVTTEGEQVMKLVVQEDFQTAVTNAATAAGKQEPTVTVTQLDPQVSTTPAVGMLVSYTVVNGEDLGQAAIEESILNANLTLLNDGVLSAASMAVPGFKARVLPAAGPSSVSPVLQEALLGVSGPAFLWDLVFAFANLDEEAQMLLQTPFNFDLQNTLDESITTYLVVITSNVVNSSGYYGVYSVYQMPNSARARAAGNIESSLLNVPLPLYTESVDNVFAATPDIEKYRALMPTTLMTTTHLFSDPNPSAVENATIISTIESTSRLYFSGTAAGWLSAVQGQHSALDAAVIAAAKEAVDRSGFRNSYTVDSAYTVYHEKEVVEGLYVELRVVQGVTVNSVHPFNANEVSSVLNNEANYSAVLALYTGVSQNASQSFTGVSVPSLVSVNSNGEYGLQCTNTCVGMVIMAAVAVFLMLVIFLVACVSVCCCFLGPAEREDEPRKASAANNNRVDVLVEDTNGNKSRMVRYNSIADERAKQAAGYPAKPEAAAVNPLDPSHSKRQPTMLFDDEGRPVESASSPSDEPNAAGGPVPLKEGPTVADEVDSFHYIPTSVRRSDTGVQPSAFEQPPPLYNDHTRDSRPPSYGAVQS